MVITYKKKFGQNFLINNKIIKKIIDSSNIKTSSEILEVGPGDGSLTKKIIMEKPEKFIAIEIDKSLKENLDSLFYKKTNQKYEILFKDALKFDETSKFNNNFKIISNLPYNVSLPLLIKWINQLNKYPVAKKMILMFQKEVAERILAKINSKKYGRISILSSVYYDIKKIIDVDKKNFFPMPKVNSSVLVFDLLKKPMLDISNIENLQKITLELFNNRRKKLKKKLQTIFSNQIIKKNFLEQLFDLRAENITPQMYCKLALLLKKN